MNLSFTSLLMIKRDTPFVVEEHSGKMDQRMSPSLPLTVPFAKAVSHVNPSLDLECLHLGIRRGFSLYSDC